MTNEETRLVKQQLDEAYKFQANTEVWWVHDVANKLVSKIKSILQASPDDDHLDLAEGDVQDLCDVFAGLHKDKYQHEDCYHLAFTKYDKNQEPFNHAWNIHKLMDMVKGEVLNSKTSESQNTPN